MTIHHRHANPATAPRPDDFRLHEETVSRAWMVTFSDLISLMLTFFVMLFAMSNVNLGNWEEITDALQRTLNPTEEKKQQIFQPSDFNISTVIRASGANLDYLASVMRELLSKDAVLRDSIVMRMDDRVLIALPGDALFETGRAIMTDDARDAMFSLSGVLRNINNQIGVNGHSDHSKPAGGAYDSNWELSIARAASVRNLLRESGVEQDIVAYGFSDSRYDELPDLPDEQRSAMARRVDIVIFPTVGD